MLICAGGLGLASLLGSTVGLVVRKIPHRWNDIFLGFCAGMMLTASLACLIMPAVEMAGRNGWIAYQPVPGAQPPDDLSALAGDPWWLVENGLLEMFGSDGRIDIARGA